MSPDGARPGLTGLGDGHAWPRSRRGGAHGHQAQALYGRRATRDATNDSQMILSMIFIT